MALTIDVLAAEPRWDPARLLGLPGRCRGDLLGPWGVNVNARFGPDAVARVRRRLVAPLDTLASTLTSSDWVPASTQVVVTEAIVDELLGGDMRALYPLLLHDTRASVNRVELVLVRTLGAKRVFRMGPRTFRKVYDHGNAEVEVDGSRARMTFRGHPLFGHPSWRMLQLFAMRAMLELAGTPGEAVGEEVGADGFVAVATW